MTRVIKFRAWDKEDKVMMDWHTYKEEICEAIPIDCGDEWTERCEVMQFTGLLDKNGREIYEGDIVKWGHNIATIGANMGVCFDGGFEEGIGEIFMTELGVFIGEDKPLWDIICHLQSGDLTSNIEEFENIGNIYENPELIGEVKE